MRIRNPDFFTNLCNYFVSLYYMEIPDIFLSSGNRYEQKSKNEHITEIKITQQTLQNKM
jgi:hypothetical protein